MTRKSYSLNQGYGVFLIPGVIGFMAIVIIPFLINIYISFTRWSGVGAPVWTGLANFQKAMGDSAFWASFQHNVSLLFAITTIPTFIGLLLAVILFDYVANKFGKSVANFLRAGFYLPQVLPVAVAGIVWGWILQPDWGALNNLLKAMGLSSLAHDWLGDSATALPTVMAIMMWFQIGYPLVILMSALQRLDPELVDAAAIDGASWLQRLFYVTVPLIRPEIYVVTLTTMIYTLKIFGPIYVLTRGGPGTATMVASYFSYKNFFENANVGYGATMSTVLTVVIMIITFVYVRLQTQQEAQESL
jgi:raffinose/stachyose/melibiose transport system permease protein